MFGLIGYVATEKKYPESRIAENQMLSYQIPEVILLARSHRRTHIYFDNICGVYNSTQTFILTQSWYKYFMCVPCCIGKQSTHVLRRSHTPVVRALLLALCDQCKGDTRVIIRGHLVASTFFCRLSIPRPMLPQLLWREAQRFACTILPTLTPTLVIVSSSLLPAVWPMGFQY